MADLRGDGPNEALPSASWLTTVDEDQEAVHRCGYCYVQCWRQTVRFGHGLAQLHVHWVVLRSVQFHFSAPVALSLLRRANLLGFPLGCGQLPRVV